MATHKSDRSGWNMGFRLVQKLFSSIANVIPNGRFFALLAIGLACSKSDLGWADQDKTPGESHQARALRIYHDAKAHHQANPSDTRLSWEFARACYDLADFAPDRAQREALALEGIKTSRATLQSHPRVAPAHYSLALNLGQLARTKTLRALALVNEMETHLLRGIELDAKFDFAGSHRALGILYRDAPGWPVSIGSKSKAESHLKKALALFPDYPGNHLTLLESHLEWGDKEKAEQKIDAARQAMQTAREELTGPQWALSWEEWNSKWSDILSQIGIQPNSP